MFNFSLCLLFQLQSTALCIYAALVVYAYLHMCPFTYMSHVHVCIHLYRHIYIWALFAMCFTTMYECLHVVSPHVYIYTQISVHIHVYMQFSSVHFSNSVLSDSLRPHELQHTRPPCPSPTPGVHSDSQPSSPWCHPAILSWVVPFSSCPQSLPASESFPMSQSLHELAKVLEFQL